MPDRIAFVEDTGEILLIENAKAREPGPTTSAVLPAGSKVGLGDQIRGYLAEVKAALDGEAYWLLPDICRRYLKVHEATADKWDRNAGAKRKVDKALDYYDEELARGRADTLELRNEAAEIAQCKTLTLEAALRKRRKA